jgi:hypothetical protein
MEKKLQFWLCFLDSQGEGLVGGESEWIISLFEFLLL